MHFNDVIQFAFHAMQGYRSRTYLMLLAMAIGVASVILLTSLGEGARLYVTQQFSSLGTNLLIVLPGRSETTGGMPPIMGETPRDLTLQDVAALQHLHHVKQLAPIVVGAAPVSYQQLEREVMIMGSTASLFSVRQLKLSRGQFLPELEITRASPVCVLGYTLYKELFGNVSPLGKWVRVSEYRCRVIGVMEEEGMSLGMDMGEVLIMPAASAQTLFNVNSVFRILVEAQSQEVMDRLKQDVIETISARHDGEDDITVLSQDALLSTFNRILTALTYALGGIAAISLLVAGIMIMNVMLVAAAQRTTEIGLIKAIGAPRKQIIILFLTESACLSLVGAMLGLIFGLAGNWLLQRYFPDFPFQAPDWALWAAVGVALSTGILFGLLPARHAADLDPVQALSGR
ncbi:MAG: ABC transporter permease [Gammaproteobacteria bacterium]|nr:ABC transporter permease [Gammaproteobacteria bacterium]MCW8923489.1 ABC transporter permease [Gammaproteobacteria bacterium]